MLIHSRANWIRRVFLNSIIRELTIAPLAMLAIFRLTFADFLSGDRSVATFQDNTHLLHPVFSHISMSFSRGESPYWIHSLMAGLPLYNTPQFSLTYPLYFFHFGLYADPVSTIMQIHYVTVLHLFILYLNTYVLLRVLRLPVLPSLLGATLLLVSGNTFAYSVWVNVIASYSWLPLLLAAIVLILERRRTRPGVLLGSFSLAMLIMASPSQALIHAAFLIGILYASRLLRSLRPNNLRALIRPTLGLFLMGVVGVSIAAPGFLSTLFANTGMIRFLGDTGAVVGYERLPFSTILTGQVKPANLAATIIPLAGTAVVGNPFVGIGAVLLALFAGFKARSNWLIWPILFITVYALLSATGDHLWFARINYFIPLMNKIREPTRHLFLFSLGISILAAFGFSYLVENLRIGYRALLNRKFVVIVLTFLVLLGLSLRSKLTYIGVIPKPVLILIFAIAFSLLLVLPWLKGWKCKTLQCLIIALIVYGTAQYQRPILKVSEGDYYAPENLISHRTLAELAKIRDIQDYRIIFQDSKLSSQFWSMNASYYGLRTFQAYMNPLPNEQFQQVFQRFDLRHYYPMLGAKYYLCNPCNAALIRDYDLKGELSGYNFYVARQPLPKYSVINRLAGVYQYPEDFYKRINAGYDFTSEAYLDHREFEYAAKWLEGQSSPPVPILKEETASLNYLRLRINSQERSIFLLNEYYTSDWKASINGNAARIFPVNLNQVGLLLEKGDNLIEFEYRPTVFVWLLRFQRIVLAVACLFLFYMLFSRTYRLYSQRRTIQRRPTR